MGGINAEAVSQTLCRPVDRLVRADQETESLSIPHEEIRVFQPNTIQYPSTYGGTYDTYGRSCTAANTAATQTPKLATRLGRPLCLLLARLLVHLRRVQESRTAGSGVTSKSDTAFCFLHATDP